MSDEKAFTIRSYRSSDRAAVRELCCQTGFLGVPIDPVYEDRQLFADFLTTYYTDHEPESSFVLEVDGEIRGYLLGSRRPLQNQLYALYQNIWLFFCALVRYFRYHARSPRFIRWTLVHAWRAVPAPARRKNVRALRLQSLEPRRDYQVQGVLSAVSLSQHRHQKFGDGRAAFGHVAFAPVTLVRSTRFAPEAAD